MALNIPMPQLPGQALMSGMNTGGQLFSRIMQPIIQREQLAEQGKYHQGTLQHQQQQLSQQQEQFLQNLALRKQAEARMASMSGLQRQMAGLQMQKLRNQLDPNYEINQYKALEDMIRGGGKPRVQQNEMPTKEMGQGMGMFSPQGLEAQKTAPVTNENSNSGGIDMELLKAHPMLRGFAKKHLGYDPLQETPEQKRAADLQNEMELANFKSRIKTGELETKEKKSLQKDLPTLEKSLKGVDTLINIAKNNPDMFGHSFMPDRFAKTTKIKDFGTWQNLISDAIAGLEGKLSSKGNVVALKMAAQLKPSHAEQQEVALGKLESMKGQLIDAINNSRTGLGQEKIKEDNKNMDISSMSDEELMKIASGGQ